MKIENKCIKKTEFVKEQSEKIALLNANYEQKVIRGRTYKVKRLMDRGGGEK